MLTIALLGDLHYPAALDQDLREARDRFIGPFLTTFFSEKAEFHVSIGDITHLGLQEEFMTINRLASCFPVQFRVVPGNHDVLGMPKKDMLPLLDKPLYGTIETDQAILLFLDTTKELELHGWGLDGEQWGWLEQTIEQSPDKTMLVFAHHPVPGTTVGSPPADGAFLPYQDIRPILQRRRTGGLYFNGHTHTHSIISREGWHYIQTAAAYCHPGYRLIEIDGTKAQIRTVTIEDAEMTIHARTLHDQLKSFHRPINGSFEPADLQLSIS